MASRLRGYFNKQRIKITVYFNSLRTRIANLKFSQVMKSRGFLLAVYLVVMVGLAGLWWWNSPYRLGNNPINLPETPPVSQNAPKEEAPPIDASKEPKAPAPDVETPSTTEEQPEPVEASLPVLSLAAPIDKIKKPVEGPVASPYGFKWSKTYQDFRWHHGVGIATTQGTPVVAAYAGRVESIVEQDPEWGSKVTIEHGSGWKSVYANVAKVSVRAGQSVKEGEQIGQVGPNPPARSANGPELYFALYEREESVDPTAMFR